MKRYLVPGLLLALLALFAVPAAAAGGARLEQAASPQTYEVMVGWEDPHQGVGVMAFFPETVYVHAGDTVHWVQTSNEIHTVTFLAGTPMPDFVVPAPPGPSPLMLNPMVAFPAGSPDGQYDGSSYTNSGIMGMEPGQVREYSLTFTEEGSYDYICVVHGQMMSGKVVVVSPGTEIPSPAQAAAQGQQEIAGQLAQVQAVVQKARAEMKPGVTNPDGTTTHYVAMGYSQGQIDLMRFFPNKMVVRPGDTVVWEFSSTDVAPHTVTFFNGGEEPDIFVAVPQPSGPPLLYLSPEVMFPQGGATLTREGYFNSGLMDPHQPGPPSYTLKIGDITGLIEYECVLHDSSGMDGSLVVVPR